VIRTVATSILRDPATDALPKRIAETLAKGRELVKAAKGLKCQVVRSGARLDSAVKIRCAPVVPLLPGRQAKPLKSHKMAQLF
jgi:hypothetical protein